MNKRLRNGVIVATLAVFVIAAGLLGHQWIQGKTMSEKTFSFQIGKTMKEMAAQTRMQLNGENNWGRMNASTPHFPDGVYGIYAEAGSELKLGPLSNILFFSDTRKFPDQKIDKAIVGFRLDHLKTPRQAYDYIFGLIGQFQQSQWKRYIPEKCPRLQGKSSLLNQDEIEVMIIPELKQFAGIVCPLDPAYQPPFEEWITNEALREASYLWHDGKGKMAELDLSVRAPEPNQVYGLGDITINLEFELQEVKLDNEKARLEAELKGQWGERVAKVEKENRRLRDLLEAQALKRKETLAER